MLSCLENMLTVHSYILSPHTVLMKLYNLLKKGDNFCMQACCSDITASEHHCEKSSE